MRYNTTGITELKSYAKEDLAKLEISGTFFFQESKKPIVRYT